MLKLKQVRFIDIQHWFVDYQKKSKNYEMPPEASEFWGIYRNEELIGYFITVAYKSGQVEINQGYLKPEARHKNLSRISLQLLENLVKQAGYKELMLATNRAVGSYQKFMRNCGFSLTKAVFSKKVL